MTANEYITNLMQKVRDHMKTHHITQNELSKRTGIAVCTLSRIFNCLQHPHLYTFCIILNALNLDINLEERR